MNQLILPMNPELMIRSEFSSLNIEIQSLDKRDYPEETIFVVYVDEADFSKAADLGNRVDMKLSEIGVKGFVVVRQSEALIAEKTVRLKLGVSDPKISELINLINSRSRTSEIQPSLFYFSDSADRLSTVIAPRHHLIFGRRGVGKTALMVEAKKIIKEKGDCSIWANIQTLRHESAGRAFLFICQKVCDLVRAFYSSKSIAPSVLVSATNLSQTIEGYLSSKNFDENLAIRLIPNMQSMIKRFLESSVIKLYIFLDDLHYLPPREQPIFLDMVHSIVRDCDAWLKIAGIKHLSRWFQTQPLLGLQMGHDADSIDLDITLENPAQAKKFLERILKNYAKHTAIASLSSIFSKGALDRLVLASGAVPRDYLVLSGKAINQAKTRDNAKLVGVQDVNKVAGEIADVKIAELEDDAASSSEKTPRVTRALQELRSFCIDSKGITFFRIDFRDKEKYSEEYGVVQELMDLRLVHLLDASLSDERVAGRHSEVYMLDLSQFSGQRLKRKLKVLDFESGKIVLKETGTQVKTKIGDSPKQRVGLLRRGPLFDLLTLKENQELREGSHAAD